MCKQVMKRCKVSPVLFLASSFLVTLLAAMAPRAGAQQQGNPRPPADIPDPVVLAAAVAQSPKQILVNFDQENLSQWGRASSHAQSRATYELVPVPDGGKALHAVIPDFAEWDNIDKTFTKSPFPEGHTLTCFRAKGRPETRQLALEWQEKDGSRWIATVDLTTEWKNYALPPEAFRPWLPPAGRGGPGDRLRVENARRFLIGLAVSHTNLTPGFQEFWFDDLCTASARPATITLKGVVTTVVDAETLMIRGIGNVRLIGVTALRDPRRKPRPDDDVFGEEADRATRRLAAGHRVRVEVEQPHDRTGRPVSGGAPSLAWVFLEDGTLLNEQLVRRGYARVRSLPESARFAARLRAAEREARAAGRGLWPAQRR